jgi:hypothetical protein
MSVGSGKAGFAGQGYRDCSPDESLIRLRSAGMAILLQNARINI